MKKFIFLLLLFACTKKENIVVAPPAGFAVLYSHIWYLHSEQWSTDTVNAESKYDKSTIIDTSKTHYTWQFFAPNDHLEFKCKIHDGRPEDTIYTRYYDDGNVITYFPNSSFRSPTVDMYLIKKYTNDSIAFRYSRLLTGYRNKVYILYPEK